MKVRFTPQARADLEDIYRYLEERSPTGAEAVNARIIRSTERLAEHPLLGVETDESGVRELTIVRYPYKIYYLIEGDEVRIVHIRHAMRQPWTGSNR